MIHALTRALRGVGRGRAMLLLVLCLCDTMYVPGLGGGFVYDGFGFVVGNEAIKVTATAGKGLAAMTEQEARMAQRDAANGKTRP